MPAMISDLDFIMFVFRYLLRCHCPCLPVPHCENERVYAFSCGLFMQEEIAEANIMANMILQSNFMMGFIYVFKNSE